MGKTSHVEKQLSGYQSDDDKMRYKINKEFYQKSIILKSPNKLKRSETNCDDDNARYKFPPSLSKSKIETKPKTKTKIKVNFWSNKDKQSGSRLHKPEKKSNRRHTVAVTEPVHNNKLKPTVKVLKRVSFLPTPLFSDNNIPMVTVPDDLTIQLNEEEANDLHEDLNQAFVNSTDNANYDKPNELKRKSRNSLPESSPSRLKRQNGSDIRIDGNANELEFFSKYVVQKLRKMETNQRIYSENLINTVLMFGQLGKLNGKSKIGDA